MGIERVTTQWRLTDDSHGTVSVSVMRVSGSIYLQQPEKDTIAIDNDNVDDLIDILVEASRAVS